MLNQEVKFIQYPLPKTLIMDDQNQNGKKSASPTQFQQKVRRTQSGKIILKTNKDNYLQNSRDTLGGGFYKRSQIMNRNSSSLSKKSRSLMSPDENYTLPPIENLSTKNSGDKNLMSVGINSEQLAQIVEEHPEEQQVREQDLANSNYIKKPTNQKLEIENLRFLAKSMAAKISILELEKERFSSQSMAQEVQYYLQGPHHCHFESQVKELQDQLRIGTAQQQRLQAELDKLFGIVRTYNTNGLMERNYALETESQKLLEEQQKMLVEIEMLGLQRDEWEEKYNDLQGKFVNVEATENRLNETDKRLKQLNEQYANLNKRYRERQLEVQESQHRYLMAEQEKKETIAQFDQTIKLMKIDLLKERQTQDQVKSELVNVKMELENQVEKYSQIERKNKELLAEIQDLRVNKIAVLMEEKKRLQKHIADRVQEIEELETQQRKSKMLLDNLETKIRDNQLKHEKQVQDLQIEFKRKNQEQEQVMSILKGEINQLNLQIHVQEESLRQKVAEHKQAMQHIDDLKVELDQHRKQELEYQSQITHLNTKKDTLERHLNDLEIIIQGHEEREKQQLNFIESLKTTISENEDTINQKQNQIENLTEDIKKLHLEIENSKVKIQESHEETKRAIILYQEEVLKVKMYQERVDNLQEEIKVQKSQISTLKTDKEQLNAELSLQKYNVSQLENLIHELKSEEEERTRATQEKIQQQSLQIEALKKDKQIFQSIMDTQKNTLAENNKSIEELKQQIQVSQTTIQQLNDNNNQLKIIQNELEDKLQKKDENELLIASGEYERIKIQLIEMQNQNKEEIEKRINAEMETTQTRNQRDELQFKLLELQAQLEKLKLEYQNLLENSIIKPQTEVKKKQVVPYQSHNIKQIIVDEQKFLKEENIFQLRFSELIFEKENPYFTALFWINVAHGQQPTYDQPQPFLNITSNEKEEKLLEMGIQLQTGMIYATFYPSRQYDRPTSPSNLRESEVKLTSQLQLKFGMFQLVGLTLQVVPGEFGSRMDMGLIVNGMRDDSVSVPTSVLVPEVTLSLGQVQQKQPIVYSHFIQPIIEQRPFLVKDALVITKEIPKHNIFRAIKKQFEYVYNPLPKKKRSNKIIQNTFTSSGEFINDFLLQEEQIDIRIKHEYILRRNRGESPHRQQDKVKEEKQKYK